MQRFLRLFSIHVRFSITIMFAYLILFCERLFAVTQWPFLVCFCVLSIIATTLRWDPFSWEKVGYALSPQRLSDVVHLMRVAHMFGDSKFAERLYRSTTPLLHTPEENMRLKGEAYPLEHTEDLRAFWSKVLQDQPTSREAFVALTLIHYQMQEAAELETSRTQWSILDPNDRRLRDVGGPSQ